MNRKLACVMHLYSDQNVFFKYAACSEGHSALDINRAANRCIQQLGLSKRDIDGCAEGAPPSRMPVEHTNLPIGQHASCSSHSRKVHRTLQHTSSLVHTANSLQAFFLMTSLQAFYLVPAA
jgi:hypothetical protein